MFGLFKSNPVDRLQKQYEDKVLEAMHAQRSGDIRRYSLLSEEADGILKKIEQADNRSKRG